MTGDDGGVRKGEESPEGRLREFRAASREARKDDRQAQNAARALLQSYVLTRLCQRTARKFESLNSDDLLQEVRARLLTDHKFDAEDSGVLGYLQRKVRWTAIDLIRRELRTRGGAPTDPEELPDRREVFGVSAAVDRTLLEDLKRQFNLTTKMAEVLAIDIGGFGLTLKDVAKEFDVSHASVRQLHHRALSRIADTFGNAEEIKIYSQLQKSGDVAEAAQVLGISPQEVVKTVKKIQMRIDDSLRGWGE